MDAPGAKFCRLFLPEPLLIPQIIMMLNSYEVEFIF